MLIEELLDPKIDYVFKRIFGHKGNEEITKSFLDAITKEKVTDIELDCNTITEKEILDEKVGILDIKAKINNNINCDIEMQLVDKKNIEKRILFYFSKMYTGSIRKGEDYKELKKGIVILITNHNIKKLRKIKKYITKWNIREEDNPKVILTEDLEFYILELDKVRKESDESRLNKWLNFIKNPMEVSKMEDEGIRRAREELEKISKDEHERYLAELRQKHIMDTNAVREAGYDDGLEKGLKEGREEGIKEEKKHIAKNMKEEGIDTDTISKVTELTKEEIEKL